MQHDDIAPIADLLRRIFSTGSPPSVERVHEGGSTRVYRIRRGDETYYLRVLPEQDASFAPEALAHRLLRERGVTVPDILYVEDLNPVLGRSVMLTTEIPGRALGYASVPPQIHDILLAAGRDLARINSIPVTGFGFVRRDRDAWTHLEGEYPTYRAWLANDLDRPLEVLTTSQTLSTAELRAIHGVLDRYDSAFDVQQAILSHGDFDRGHIYHQDGIYTGIIDFGEIRGTQLLYDMGHFQIEYSDGLPALLEGYAQVTALPPDARQGIQLAGLLFALRRLGRMLLTQRPLLAIDLLAVRRALQVL
jgi:aminoglycoside phosphotransferase (APT) family kinase protein